MFVLFIFSWFVCICFDLCFFFFVLSHYVYCLTFVFLIYLYLFCPLFTIFLLGGRDFKFTQQEILLPYYLFGTWFSSA